MKNSLEEIYKKDVRNFTKEDAKKIMEIPCRGRGEHLLNSEREAFKLGGAEGIKKLKEGMKKLGYPLRFNEIDPLDWYPIGLRVLTFVSFKKIFNLKDENFTEMGCQAPDFSFIAKFFFRYFPFQATIFKHIPEYWRKNYTCGKLESINFREKGQKRSFIFRLHNFKIYPLYCQYFLGYFSQIVRLMGGREVIIKETKCMFKGNPYHEFLVSWKWEPKWEQEPKWKKEAE